MIIEHTDLHPAPPPHPTMGKKVFENSLKKESFSQSL